MSFAQFTFSIMKFAAGNDKVKEFLLGPEQTNELSNITNLALASATKSELSDLPRRDRNRVRSAVEQIIQLPSVSPVIDELLSQKQNASDVDIASQIMEEAGRVGSWTETPNGLYALSAKRLLAVFLQKFREGYKASARKKGSALFNKSVLDALEPAAERLAIPSNEELRESSVSRMQYQIAVRNNDEHTRNFRIDLDFGELLDTYTKMNWAMDCFQKTHTACVNLQTMFPMNSSIAALDELLSSIDWTGNWEVIRNELSAIEFEKIEWMIRKKRSTTKRDQLDTQLKTIKDIDEDLYWIKTQIQKPTFRRCFPVLGTWGSGKSSLLHYAMGWCLAREIQAVHLSAWQVESFEGAIVGQANHLYGTNCETLDDVLDIVKRLNSKLFILVDDLHEIVDYRGTALLEVSGLVRRYTAGNVLYWIFTADELHFDAVSSNSMSQFWQQYGLSSHTDEWTNIGGWLNLDIANAESRLGLQIISKRGGESDAIEVESVVDRLSRASSFDYGLRLLCNPLPAWIRVEVGEEEGNRGLLNTERSRFVQNFWAARRDALRLQREDAVAMEAIMTAIASCFHRLRMSSITLARLKVETNDIISQPLLYDQKYIDRFLYELRDAGFLLIRETGDREVEISDPVVNLVPESYWGYRIAKKSIHDSHVEVGDVNYVFEEIRHWGIVGISGDPLGETVSQFALTILAEQYDGVASREIWEKWGEDEELGNIGLLLSGVWAGNSYQSIVVQSLKRRPHSVVSNRSIFALLRFILHTGLSGWTPDRRFELTKPHYDGIGQLGLGRYLLFCIETIVHRQEFGDAARYPHLLLNLTGVERSGVADEAARIVVRQSWQAFDANVDAWLEGLTKFLRLSTLPQSGDDFPDDRVNTSVVFFWRSVVREAMELLVEERSTNAFRHLTEAGWYTAGQRGKVARHVGVVMKSEANAALGAHYRMNRFDDAVTSNYQSLVERLLWSDFPGLSPIQQSEAAFFLIRHTEVTAGGRRTLFDPRFHRYLLELWMDPQARRQLGHWLEEAVEWNGIVKLEPKDGQNG